MVLAVATGMFACKGLGGGTPRKRSEFTGSDMDLDTDDREPKPGRKFHQGKKRESLESVRSISSEETNSTERTESSEDSVALKLTEKTLVSISTISISILTTTSNMMVLLITFQQIILAGSAIAPTVLEQVAIFSNGPKPFCLFN